MPATTRTSGLVRKPPAAMSCDRIPHHPATAEDAALRLYQLLRQHGCASRGDIAAEAGLPPDLAALGWEYLVRLGLVREATDTGDLAALAPDAALAGILARHRSLQQAQFAEIDYLSRAAESLTGRYRRMVADESAGARVEIVRGGASQRNQLLLDMNQHTRQQSDSMHPGPLPPAGVLASSLAEDAKLLGRGVRVRALYGQTASGTPRTRKYLADLAALGAEVRLAPHVPFDLLLSDTDVAYLLVTPTSAGDSMAELRGELLVGSYQALYDHCWSQATPVQPAQEHIDAARHQLVGIQHTIIRLMCDGLSDEQICRRLRVSTRTLRRHITQIMDILGADSRCHAGVLAAESGLLNRPMPTSHHAELTVLNRLDVPLA